MTVGTRVNYHSVIGGPPTSFGHTIIALTEISGEPVAFISEKVGCVSVAALSLAIE